MDQDYIGSQFPEEDDAFWQQYEGPSASLEDFNSGFEPLPPATGDPSLAWDNLGHIADNDLLDGLDLPLIGISPADDDFDFGSIHNWEGYTDFEEALSSIQDSQLPNEEPQSASHVSSRHCSRVSVILRLMFVRVPQILLCPLHAETMNHLYYRSTRNHLHQPPIEPCQMDRMVGSPCNAPNELQSVSSAFCHYAQVRRQGI